MKADATARERTESSTSPGPLTRLSMDLSAENAPLRADLRTPDIPTGSGPFSRDMKVAY
jgi:hypothetical protein